MISFLTREPLLARFFAALLIFIASFLPFVPDAAILIMPDTVSAQTESLTVTFKNNTNRELAFMPDYYVERKTEDGWERCGFREGSGVNEIIIQLPPFTGSELNVELSQLAQPLRPGTYRLVKNYTSAASAAREYSAYAEFEVT